MRSIRGIRGAITAALVAFVLAGCGDLLTVSDPARYTSDDLDGALDAVGNGVEGALHEVMDNYVIYQALLSDEYQHSGTWIQYDEVDHGRFQYGTHNADGTQDAWLRTRWFAQDAEARFNRVLGEAEAANDPLMAQVHMTEGLVELYLGMGYCESPGEPSGPALTDMQILQQAVTKLTRAIQTAQAAGRADYETAALAGRATAYQMLGDYENAAADASAVPDGFSYDAVFNKVSNNSVVSLTTKTFNQAASIMHGYWDQIDASDDPGLMRDPWTDEPDPRMPVFYDGEDVATDNETLHRSQWKYSALEDDIPMVHSDGMRLIEAEALAFGSPPDYDAAMAILNDLRGAVGLTALPTPTTEPEMRDYLLSERFAEHFFEGMRAVDLHRFGLVDEVFNALGDPDRVGTNRPTKFSLTGLEASYNPEITDDLAQRCLPRAS